MSKREDLGDPPALCALVRFSPLVCVNCGVDRVASGGRSIVYFANEHSLDAELALAKFR